MPKYSEPYVPGNHVPADGLLPTGFTWDHTTVEATARLENGPMVHQGYVPGVITVRTFFTIDPGTLPDMKHYRSATFLFRPTRLEVRFTDGAWERAEVSGRRVLKSGAVSDRQASSYQAWSGEIKTAVAVYRGEGVWQDELHPHLPEAVVGVVDAHLHVHPLPTLAVAE